MRTWRYGLWSAALAVLLLGSGQAHAAASLGLGAANGAPGDSVQLGLTLVASQPLAALQADVRYDPAVLSYQSLSPQPPSGALIESRLLSPGHLRIVLYSLACPGFSRGAGGPAEIAVLHFAIAATAPAGTAIVSLHDPVYAAVGGAAEPAGGLTPGQITITGSPPGLPPGAGVVPIPAGSWFGWTLLGIAILVLGVVAARRYPGQTRVLLLVATVSLAAGPRPALAGLAPGDANGDGAVDNQDAVLIGDVILGRATAPGNPDCNADGLVNALDIACVVATACNTPANDPPVLASIADQFAVIDQAFQLDAEASDPDTGDTLGFSLDQSPAGMAIDPASGVINWTPQSSDVGNHTVIVRVTDAGTLFDTEDFVLTVNADNSRPALLSIADQIAAPNDNFAVDANALDPDSGDVLAYSLISPPTGMTIDAATGQIAWTPTSGQLGDHLIRVRVTDPGGLADERLFLVQVLAGGPPVLGALVDGGAEVGDAFSRNLTATDPDAGDTLTWSLLAPPVGMIISPATGALNWTPAASQLGSHEITVRVTDSTGRSDQGSFSLTVANPQAPVAVDDAWIAWFDETLVVPAPGVLANDSDANGDPLTASLVGGPANGTLNFNADGSFDYLSSLTFSGVYTTQSVVDFDLSTAMPRPIGEATSTVSPYNAMDGDLTTLWYAYGVSSGEVFYQQQFYRAITVQRLELWYRNGNYDFQTGRVQFFDASGNALHDTGIINFPPGNDSGSDPDLVLDIAALAGSPVAGVSRVRFSSSDYESGSPGFVEFHVIGDGIVHQSNITEKAAMLGDSGVATSSFMASDVNGDHVTDFAATVWTGDGARDTFTVASGADGSVLWEVFNNPFCANPPELLPALQNLSASTYSRPTMADLDGDGRAEVLHVFGDCDPNDPSPGYVDRTNRIVAFEEDGSVKWVSGSVDLSPPVDNDPAQPTESGGIHAGPASVADLDGDGQPEVMVGYDQNRLSIFNGATGALIRHSHGGTYDPVTDTWAGGGHHCCGEDSQTVVVADLNLDGSPEIITGDDVYAADGTWLWSEPYDSSLHDEYQFGRFVAVANLDDDPYGEVIFTNTSGLMTVAEHDGSAKWFRLADGTLAGPVSIADTDGDGDAEIMRTFFPGGYDSEVRVIDHLGNLVWNTLVEFESRHGSYNWQEPPTPFDFDRDGIMELVQRTKTHLYFLDARDGTVLLTYGLAQGNYSETQPKVLDADGDGTAEIVSLKSLGSLGVGSQLVVLGPATGVWPQTRPFWNTPNYHITNVQSDGTVPVHEKVNWLTPGLNNFRVNVLLPEEIEPITDTFTYVANDGSADSNTATVTITVEQETGAPEIVSSPRLFASPGYAYQYGVLAADPDVGDTLSYQLNPAPPGMSISGLGIITWMPSAGDLGQTFVVGVRVEDQTGLAANQLFEVQVVSAVSVPDVTGDSQADAEAALDAVMLGVGNIVEQFSTTVPIGHVISQTPTAGTTVAAGSAVNLLVSIGAQPLVMPELTGRSQSAAEDLITALGLTVGTISTAYSGEIPKGLILSQAVAPGSEVLAGSAVDFTLSVGPRIRLTLATPVILAGASTGVTVDVFDLAGNPVSPSPAHSFSINALPGAQGAPPVVVPGSLTTSGNTRGAYTVTVTLTADGDSTVVPLTVVSPGGSGVQDVFVKFSADLIELRQTISALADAVEAGDNSAIASLHAELLALRDRVVLEDLRETPAFAPEGGFPPAVEQMPGLGYPETPADAAYIEAAKLLSERVAALEQALLDASPTGGPDDVAILRELADQVAGQQAYLASLHPTLNGRIAAAPWLSHLAAVRVPRLVHAEVASIDLALADAGFAAGPVGSKRTTFFNLIGIMNACEIRQTIIEDIYFPILQDLAISMGTLIAADLLQEYANAGQLVSVIAGGSVSIHVFKAPWSAVEGFGFDAEIPEANKVMVVGPDAFSAVQDAIGAIGDAATSDLNSLSEALQGVEDAAQGVVDAYNDANAVPDNVVRGCLFDPSPACQQMIYPDGFESVYHTDGLEIPAPVLFLSWNVNTGGFAVFLANFVPTAPPEE